jgi:uncharacterized membrane protein
LVLLLASGFFSPLGWRWNSGSYGLGIGPGVWAGFGFPIMGLGMFFFCLLMMGGMMLHGQPFGHGAGRSVAPWPGESNLDILQRRYSQGEITQDQFEQMKRDLGL